MQALGQMLDVPGAAANLDFHTLGIVTYPAGELELLGQTPDEGTKSNPLNNAIEPDTMANNVRVIRNLHEIICPEMSVLKNRPA